MGSLQRRMTTRQIKGCYKNITQKRYNYLKVEDDVVTFHSALRPKPLDNISIEYGEFDEVHPKIANITGKSHYNFKLIFTWDEFNVQEEQGLISEDGTRLYFKIDHDPDEIKILESISEAEADAIVADEGDPIDAPPGPYILQPENQGRLLWLTGAPGSGKSTTAQLLGRLKGYVYYEVDCFRGVRNPYIALDVPNPTMDQESQRPLMGEGREERKAKKERADKTLQKILFDNDDPTEEDLAALDDMTDCLAADIQRERKRIGGDWVVAGCLTQARERDRIRSLFGSDLLMIHLVISDQEVTERLEARHPRNEKIRSILTDVAKHCKVDDDDDNELDNDVVVKVTNSMEKEEVLEAVLAEADKYYSSKIVLT